MPVVEPKKSTFPITDRMKGVPQVQQFPPTPGTVIGNGDAPQQIDGSRKFISFSVVQLI